MYAHPNPSYLQFSSLFFHSVYPLPVSTGNRNRIFSWNLDIHTETMQLSWINLCPTFNVLNALHHLPYTLILLVYFHQTSTTDYDHSTTRSPRLHLPGLWPGTKTKREACLMRTWFDIVQVNKVISLTLLLWVLRNFRRFAFRSACSVPTFDRYLERCDALLNKAQSNRRQKTVLLKVRKN